MSTLVRKVDSRNAVSSVAEVSPIAAAETKGCSGEHHMIEWIVPPQTASKLERSPHKSCRAQLKFKLSEALQQLVTGRCSQEALRIRRSSSEVIQRRIYEAGRVTTMKCADTNADVRRAKMIGSIHSLKLDEKSSLLFLC